MLSRRAFLRLLQAAVATGAMGGSWALAEPFWLRVQRYAFTPPNWPGGLKLRVAIVADLHACEPWMNGGRVADIAATTQALEADCILLLGDYIATHRFAIDIPHGEWAEPLGRLQAPLGVHAVLGNHDWWSDARAMRSEDVMPAAGRALRERGVRVYQNDAVRLSKDGHAFWLAGLGDQVARLPIVGHRGDYGVDDLAGTLAQVGDDAPIILMAHEPDIFVEVPARVSLTISGHTHGGQVRLFGYAPVAPSRLSRRYVYGHMTEDDRHIVVSGGLGCSGLPIRFGSPPEIVVLDLGSAA